MNQKEFIAWLEEDFQGEQNVKVWERISFLVFANGGWEVTGWGVITYGTHQQGLEQNEALELKFLSGMFYGITEFGGFNAYDEFFPYFEKYNTLVKEKINNEG